MEKKEKTQEQEFEENPQVLSIKKSDEKFNFWKPKKVGEVLKGKLVRIAVTQFGEVLRIQTSKGIIAVALNVFLKDIDFTQFANETLIFTFKGVVGERGCRIYDVDKVLGKDEVSF